MDCLLLRWFTPDGTVGLLFNCERENRDQVSLLLQLREPPVTFSWEANKSNKETKKETNKTPQKNPKKLKREGK